jgi:hypothetical protein
MTFPEAVELLEYWQECPPEHEFLALFARVYTSWEPKSVASMTEEEVQAANLRQIEKRWASGQALSPKQMMDAFGGARVGIGSDGVFRGADGRALHKFPGMN